MNESSGDSYTGRFETLGYENDLSAAYAILLSLVSGDNAQRFAALLFE